MNATMTILFIVTSHAMIGHGGEPTGVWFEELSTPYYAFVDKGYSVRLASIDGGEIPIDPRSQQEDGSNPPSVERFLKDKVAMDKLHHSAAIENIDPSNFAAIFLPGGHGTMWDFSKSEVLASIVSDTLEDGRIVAAVCHGPAGLINAKDKEGNPVVKGKTIAAFTNEEEEAVGLTEKVPFLLESRLRELGANIQQAPKFEAIAVRDGNLITGQNPASSEKVAELVIEALKEQSTE